MSLHSGTSRVRKQGSVGLEAVLSYMPLNLWGWGKIKGRQLPSGFRRRAKRLRNFPRKQVGMGRTF